ncbi:MAG: hypothetical protein AAGB00_12345 [Planctomycetota bacterium]
MARRRWRHLMTLGVVLPAIGCGQDEIRSYTAPAVSGGDGAASPPALAVETPAGEPTHRMLAAVVRGADRAWFFKLTGEESAVSAVAEDVAQVFSTVRMNGEKGVPEWELPAGWRDEGKSGMRFTTLRSPDATGSLELSVTPLATSPDWQRLVLDNVNRWRGQMKLPPLPADKLNDAALPMPNAPKGSVAVSIDGWFDAGGMRPPFAGGAAARQTPPQARPGIRPPAPASREITYQTPAGWRALPPTSMRVANLVTAEGDGAASVRASVFPDVAEMGVWAPNVARWRGQAGLPPLDSAGVDAAAEEVEIGGAAGKLIEIVGETRSMTAAMVKREGQVWFFILDGKPDEVASNNDKYRDWVGSIAFDGEGKPQPNDESATTLTGEE